MGQAPLITQSKALESKSNYKKSPRKQSKKTLKPSAPGGCKGSSILNNVCMTCTIQ